MISSPRVPVDLVQSEFIEGAGRDEVVGGAPHVGAPGGKVTPDDVLYLLVQYSTAQYSTVQYSTVPGYPWCC